jgi:hypothetical protein
LFPFNVSVTPPGLVLAVFVALPTTSKANEPPVVETSQKAEPTAELPDIVILTEVAPTVLDNT